MDLETLQKEFDELKAQHAKAVEEKDAAASELAGKLAEKEAELEVERQKAADVVERLENLEAKLAAPAIIKQTDAAESRLKVKHKDEFLRWMKTGETTELVAKGTDLQTAVDTSGGFAVPDELVRSIIKQEYERSPIRQVASVRSASTPQVEQLVSTGSAASGWVAEADPRAQTDTPDLAQRTATFGEVYARPRAYQHVLEDAFFDVEGWLADEVSRQFSEVSGVAFLSGDGVNKPVGILEGLTAPTPVAANQTTGRPQVIASATLDALGADDAASIKFLRSIVTATTTGYLSNAVWMMNRASYEFIVNFADQNGQFYLNMDIANAEKRTIFGYPVVINEDMDDIPGTAAGSFPIMFGDFSRHYQILDRTGVSVLRDPYTNPGSIMFYTRKRVGSMRLDAEAVKVVTVDQT